MGPEEEVSMTLLARDADAGTAHPPSPSLKEATPGQRRTQYQALVLHSASELMAHHAAWLDLAHHAIEPNPHFEPWMLLPAIAELGRNETLRFVLVYRESPDEPRRALCAFFPFIVQSQFRGLAPRALPVRTLSVWRYHFCYLATPLIRVGSDPSVLDPLFQWLASGAHGCQLMELPWLSEGAFHRLLVQRFHRLGTLSFIAERHTRALLERRASAEEYLKSTLQSRDLRELRRRERILRELGVVRFRESGPEEDVEAMLSQFLDLEARSWKGQAGCDLASTEGHLQFFRTAARAGMVNGRVRIQGLYLNDKPVAMRCLLVGGDGAFSFKISYDPEFARYGPGIQLEVEGIRRLHNTGSPIRWVDSCATHNNPMFNRIYNSQRVMQSLVLGIGWRGQLMVSLMPLARFAHRVILHRELLDERRTFAAP